jgi:hypothetical protein
MLHYYFPKMQVTGYLNENEVPAGRRSGNFDAVLYRDYSLEIGATGLRR